MKKPPLNAYADLSSGARGLNFGLILHLHPDFVYDSMQAAKALVSLHICADTPEPSLLVSVISTKISCAVSYANLFQTRVRCYE